MTLHDPAKYWVNGVRFHLQDRSMEATCKTGFKSSDTPFTEYSGDPTY